MISCCPRITCCNAIDCSEAAGGNLHSVALHGELACFALNFRSSRGEILLGDRMAVDAVLQPISACRISGKLHVEARAASVVCGARPLERAGGLLSPCGIGCPCHLAFRICPDLITVLCRLERSVALGHLSDQGGGSDDKNMVPEYQLIPPAANRLLTGRCIGAVRRVKARQLAYPSAIGILSRRAAARLAVKL